LSLSGNLRKAKIRESLGLRKILHFKLAALAQGLLLTWLGTTHSLPKGKKTTEVLKTGGKTQIRRLGKCRV
jgi:hypothetical protein